MMPQSNSYFTLLLFILVVAMVALSGVQFPPGDWYEHLIKPSWTPPNWLFPVVWSLLYLMIAIAGWLIFSASNFPLKILWVAQLLFNGLWSWLFFGMHLTVVGLIDILLMFFCIAAILVISRKTSKIVTWLMSPYLVWVGIASSLNAAIYLLNFA